MIEGDRLPRIRGMRVDLRPLGPADVDSLFEIFGDPQVTRYWSTPALPDRAAAVALLDTIDDGFETRTLLQWGIARRDDDAVVGTVTLAGVDPSNRRAEIGFALGRDHWGRGLAAEGVGLVLGFAFATLGLNRIEAEVDPGNEASLRLVEAAGFQREGLLRERCIVGGRVDDAYLYALLAREWPQATGEKNR